VILFVDQVGDIAVEDLQKQSIKQYRFLGYLEVAATAAE